MGYSRKNPKTEVWISYIYVLFLALVSARLTHDPSPSVHDLAMANPEKQNGARAQNENKSHDTKFVPSPQRKPDIEHAEVSDDPRKWSKVRKVNDIVFKDYLLLAKQLLHSQCTPNNQGFVLAIISGAAMIAGLGGNIYNRKLPMLMTVQTAYVPKAAIAQIESDLHASPGQISLSLSLFIMIQGVVPLLWCAVSEIHGRKVSSLFVRLSENLT